MIGGIKKPFLLAVAKLSFCENLSLFIDFQIIAPLRDRSLNKHRALNRGKNFNRNVNRLTETGCVYLLKIFLAVYLLKIFQQFLAISTFVCKSSALTQGTVDLKQQTKRNTIEVARKISQGA